MENLSGRGFGTTCCACVTFAWEIVRDSPMVNFHSQTMNKHSRMRLGHRHRKMFHDDIGGHQVYIQREKDLFIKPRISQLTKTTRG